jgi:hypothetical protein
LMSSTLHVLWGLFGCGKLNFLMQTLQQL